MRRDRRSLATVPDGQAEMMQEPLPDTRFRAVRATLPRPPQIHVVPFRGNGSADSVASIGSRGSGGSEGAKQGDPCGDQFLRPSTDREQATEKRLEAYNSFGVVAALMAGFALSMISSCVDGNNVFQQVGMCGFSAVIGISTVSLQTFTLQFNHGFRLYADSASLTETYLRVTRKHRKYLLWCTNLSFPAFLLGTVMLVCSAAVRPGIRQQQQQSSDKDDVFVVQWHICVSAVILSLSMCFCINAWRMHSWAYRRAIELYLDGRDVDSATDTADEPLSRSSSGMSSKTSSSASVLGNQQGQSLSVKSIIRVHSKTGDGKSPRSREAPQHVRFQTEDSIFPRERAGMKQGHDLPQHARSADLNHPEPGDRSESSGRHSRRRLRRRLTQSPH